MSCFRFVFIKRGICIQINISDSIFAIFRKQKSLGFRAQHQKFIKSTNQNRSKFCHPHEPHTIGYGPEIFELRLTQGRYFQNLFWPSSTRIPDWIVSDRILSVRIGLCVCNSRSYSDGNIQSHARKVNSRMILKTVKTGSENHLLWEFSNWH